MHDRPTNYRCYLIAAQCYTIAPLLWRIIHGAMNIDRHTLIKLLEAFVDTSEVLQRELMLYQTLFAAACKAKGLDETQTQKAVTRAREEMAPKISAESREQYLDLLAKLPQIVDMLDSDRDEAFRLLKEWTPKGPPN
jgi:hypothetical protein